MGALEQAVSTVVERCLAVRAGENVLVITDPAASISATRS